MDDRKTWTVTITPIAGLKGPSPRTLIVKAVNERTAKLSAWNTAKRGAYAHRTFQMWDIETREVNNDQAG